MEKVVTAKTPMPNGYALLKKGNAYRTSLCKRKTLGAKKPLYIVKDRSKVIGVRAPKWILSQVFAEDRETKDKRRAVVAGRDIHAKAALQAAIKAQFSKIPSDEAELVAEKAMKKRSGRVGRTSTLSLETKARLAVLAHIRHCHTKYDQLVENMVKDDARKQVHVKIQNVAKQWGANNLRQHQRWTRLARAKGRGNDSEVEVWEEESSGGEEEDEDEKDTVDEEQSIIVIDSDSDK